MQQSLKVALSALACGVHSTQRLEQERIFWGVLLFALFSVIPPPAMCPARRLFSTSPPLIFYIQQQGYAYLL